MMENKYVPCSAWVWDHLRDSEREIINFGQGFQLAGKSDAVRRVVEAAARQLYKQQEEDK
jgi:hypothetical protein